MKLFLHLVNCMGTYLVLSYFGTICITTCQTPKHSNSISTLLNWPSKSLEHFTSTLYDWYIDLSVLQLTHFLDINPYAEIYLHPF